MCVFARSIDKDLTSLVKKINTEVEKNKEKKLCSFVVFLTDDAEETEKKVKELAEKEEIKNVPLTIVEPSAGPESYKISQDAEVTVLLWKNTKLTANHGFKKGELKKDAVAAVIKDISKLLE